MKVIKRNGELEKFSIRKMTTAVAKAYKACKTTFTRETQKELKIEFSEAVEGVEIISVDEIHDFVENFLMKNNPDVAKAYIIHRDDHTRIKEFVKGKIDFINKYKKTKNTADATVDDNSNVGGKNIGILNAEIHKEDNINVSRGMIMQKLKELYPDFDSKQYVTDLESKIIYKHDESSFSGAIAPYTYSAKEVITVKYNEHILLLPFDALWDMVEEEEVLVDNKNTVYQKYPENLYVLDKNGWTNVTHITKKLRHRELVRVKTSFGEDIIVTDNHPMIISENIGETVPAQDSLGEKQYKLGDKGMFGVSKSTVVDMSQCNITSECTDTYCFNQNEHTNCWCKRTVELNWDLGYFVGFFIGDGNYDNTDGHIHFTQNDRQILLNLNSIIFKSLGIGGRLYTKKDIANCYTLDITSNYLNWLLKDYFKIQDKAYNKTLPFNIYETNEEFAKGILCGLIDSDGTVNGSQLSIRLSSRSAILQCTHLLRHFGYGVGNTKQSLPFNCNKKYKINYSLWGVNCSVRKDSINLGNSYKLQNVQTSDSSLKYKIDGITKIINVEKLSEEDSFVKNNEFIYDITTSSHTFALNNILVHNCCSITMYPFLTDGIKKVGGLSAKPKNLDSFCGMYVNLIFATSAQFAGAVATSELLLYFDFFSRKEWGEDYYKKADVEITNDHSLRPMTIRKKIHQHFQQIIYSINQPAAARGLQSAFVNFSYFDKPFFEGMFGDFYFPDGTKPVWESFCWLQKDFMMWFNEERTKCMLTFPVESFALVYKDGEFLDKDSADFVSEEYSRGHSFFTYISDTVDSLSSCCFTKDTKVLWKSSTLGVQLSTFEEMYKEPSEKSLRIFHNGSWVSGKPIKLKNRKMYKVTTANRKEFYMTDNHINVTYDGEKTTSELTTDDFLMFNTAPLQAVPEQDEKLSYAQGFAVGAFLRDGSFGPKNESALVDFIQKWTLWSEEACVSLNLDCLLQSYEFRKGILDGYSAGEDKCYTTSESLKNCMEVLITSLGINTTIDETSDREGQGWCINLCNERAVEGVSRWKNNSQYFKVIDIEEVEYQDEVYCVERDNSSDPYFTLPSGLITHNCRLKNKVQTKEFNFTNGNMGVQTGSKSVITLNLSRIVQDWAKNFEDLPKQLDGSFSDYLNEILERVYKYHIAYNELLWDMYDSGLLPVYKAGFINLDKQYLTIGINGLNQAAEFLGLQCNDNEDYKRFCQFIFGTIKDANTNKNGKYFGHTVTLNTECVPAESLAIKNYNWDKEDGLEPMSI